MASIVRLQFNGGAVDRTLWPRLVAELRAAWLAAGVPARDVVVLVPHAGLLGVARGAFAQSEGWQPRVETLRTLAESLAPPQGTVADGPMLDRSIDRLAAASLLQREPLGRLWAKQDRRAFDAAVRDIVETAHALLETAHASVPHDRDAWWQAARAALPAIQGPGGTERLLARWALEWAAGATHEPAAALWILRPAAWVIIQAGGADPLAERLLAHGAAQGVAAWRVETDPDPKSPFDAVAVGPAPVLRHAHGLEEEAMAAALAVVRAVEAGQVPVALVAEDRLVVRRIRALLERTGVALADETGWTLSTTRSAARLMAVLRAAAQDAGRDAMLDALKAEQSDDDLLDTLEAAWRRERTPDADALAWWRAARGRLTDLGGGRGARRLGDWLRALERATPRLMSSLRADPAGRAVLAALRIEPVACGAVGHAFNASTPLDLAGFTEWVTATLEETSYLPAAPASPQVVITPLSHVPLRPFGAVVFPGCDETHLGRGASALGLLSEPTRRELGLPDAQARRERERLAFAQLLRLPWITLLRRTHDEAEALAPSPLIGLAVQARRRCHQPVPSDEAVQFPTTRIEPRPVRRPAPSMAEALPSRLSASSVEALRECPYRFFARVGLGLAQAIELETEPGKRDQGRWLHAVLHAFHAERRDAPSAGPAAEHRRLREIAQRALAEQQLDADAMLPFDAAFDRLAASYLDWLHAREAEGWRYACGEQARAIAPPELDGLQLDGRLDRIDRHRHGGAMVIDYKTGRTEALARRVKEPLEDTQLAFYAALLTDEPHEPPPRAIYLALDERKPPRAIEHPDPARSAAQLIEGLAADLDALRNGAGAPALGEGDVCEHCEMRGLCRRDHWADAT